MLKRLLLVVTLCVPVAAWAFFTPVRIVEAEQNQWVQTRYDLWLAN